MIPTRNRRVHLMHQIFKRFSLSFFIISGLPHPSEVFNPLEVFFSVQWQMHGKGIMPKLKCSLSSVVGLPARPKSPVDSKKEGDSSSVYSSSLPSSDGPEHSMSSSRTQVISDKVFVLTVVCILSSFTAILAP